MLHDNVTKAVFANVVPSKGTSHAYAERALAANITLLGHRRVKIQSDQEPAILDVKNRARQHTMTELVPDESPVGDSDGNGAFERANLSVQGQVRVLKVWLELKLGATISLDSATMKWLVQHAAWTLTTYQKGADGMAAHQRILGNIFNVQVAAFGEAVLFKPTRMEDA